MLLVGFVLAVVVAASLIDFAFSLGGILVAAALFVAVGLAATSWLRADQIVLSMSKAQAADEDTYARYHNLVEGLCVAAGLPKPALYVIRDAAPNAFAIGRKPDHASVVVTTGLLDKLSRVELEGVLAHELSHIRNNDIALTTLAVPLLGLFGGRLVQLAVGDKESTADVTGVRLTRYPPGLVSALEKLKADRTALRSVSRAMSHLWIKSPVHLPLEQRIKALKDL